MSIARTQIIDGSIAPSPGDITNDPKQTIGLAIAYSNSKATYRDWGKNLLSMMLSATSGTISSDCFGRTGSIRGRDGEKSNSKPVDNKQTQAAQCVGLKVQNISDFLRSKAFKSRAGKGYTPQINARRFLGSKAIEALRGKGHTPDSFKA